MTMVAVSLPVMVEARADFEAWLRDSSRSALTIKSYLQDLGRFMAWFEQENGEGFSPEKTTTYDLRTWHKYSVEVEGVSPSTWNRRRITMKLYAAYLLDRGYLDRDVFRDIPMEDEVELGPRWIKKNVFGKIIRQMEVEIFGARTQAQQFAALRDWAMIALMAYGGLRVHEVVKLNFEDFTINPRSGYVVFKGKRGKTREVELNSSLRKALEEYFAIIPEAERVGAVFTGKGSSRISTRTVERRVKAIGEKVGLAITPHDLRASCLKWMRDNGAMIHEMQKTAGHASERTTYRYITPSREDMAELMEKIA